VRESAKDLTLRWLKQRGKSAYQPTYFLNAFDHVAIKATDKHMAVIIMDNETDKCLGYLISELTPNGIINNTSCTEYKDTPLTDTTLVLLHYAAKAWMDRGLDGATIVNRGAAVRGAGSKKQKEKLRPIKVHQNYRLKTEGKLTKPEYDALWANPVDDLEWL